MAKYVIEGETLSKIADAIRTINGTEKEYTPDEMIQAVETVLDDMVYILVDENGNETPAYLSEERVELTAGPNDIRLGTVAVTGEGVTTGEKDIPAYYVTEGYRLITAGSAFVTSPFANYDFTKLQCIICPFSSSISASVAADRIAIGDSVYAVNSNEVVSTVVRDSTNETINLGLTNTSDGLYVLRYFTYKEIY